MPAEKTLPTKGHWTAYSWLLLILAVAAALRLWVFVGVVGSDDIVIANLAQRLLESGPWVPDNHYQARIGLIYPLAVIYAFFGVGEWQTVALPFFASVVSVFLAFLIARRLCGDTVGLLAALIIAVFPLDVAGATQLMPDLPLGAAVAAAFYFALRATDGEGSRGWAIAAGLTWGYGYLIKVEAAFIGLPLAILFLMHLKQWRVLSLIFVSAALVFFTETFVYWVAGGDTVQRLHSVSNQGNLRVTEEYGAGQLWVFPKSWFITFYQFGLHYYLLLAAILWAVFGRVRALYVVVIWAVVYLLWLQFGGNPFSAHYHVKSHLDRYCSMLSVPMAILIGAFLAQLLDWRKRVGVVVLAATLLAAVFFISFNTLSFERQQATKLAIDYARKENLFPLYMDRTSYLLAGIYMHGDERLAKVRNAQGYDFDAGKTIIEDFDKLDGYVLLNRGFMEYAWNRYRMDKVDVSTVDASKEVFSVDNPGSALAYAQAKFLYGISRLIPVAFLREKIGGTAEDLLRPDDVVILDFIKTGR